MSARLQDVDAGPAQNAIAAVFNDCSIPGLKPAVPESGARSFGLTPIFSEYAGSAHFDFTRHTCSDWLSILSGQPHFDGWQRRANTARHALSSQWI